MHPRKNKMQWLRKLPVLLVYLLFFAVQLFFSYGTGAAPTSFSAARHHLQSSTVTHASVKGNASKSFVRQKVRLNKRFEPSFIPAIAVPAVLIEAAYEAPSILGHYVCRHFPEVFLADHSLRGPPVVACSFS